MKNNRTHARPGGRSIATLVVAVSAATVFPIIVNAQAVTWTGGAGGTGTDFNTGGNWAGGSVPGVGNTATFPAAVTIGQPDVSAPATLLGLAFQNTTGTWSLASGNSSALTLGSSGINAGSMTTGTLTVTAPMAASANQTWTFGPTSTSVNTAWTANLNGSIDIGTNNLTLLARSARSGGGSTAGGGNMNIRGNISGSGTLAFGSAINGSFTIQHVLSGTSPFTGKIQAGTSVNPTILQFTSIADEGTSSAVGASGPIQIGGGAGNSRLTYNSTVSASSNRQLTVQPSTTANNSQFLTNNTASTTLTLSASGSYVLPSSSNFTFSLGGAGNLDLSGIVNDAGPGITSLTKADAGTVTVRGLSTYTGRTIINQGTLVVTSLGALGEASSLGAPTTVANGTIGLGSTTNAVTLNYIGTGATTDRVIDLASTTGGPTISQSGTGLLRFTSDFTATGSGAKTLNLRGNSGEGEISGAIVDSGSGQTFVNKNGLNVWTLSGNSTYSGQTTITYGQLRVTSINSTPDGPGRAASSALGAPSSAGLATIVIGTGNNSFADLTYDGPGETTDRNIDMRSAHVTPTVFFKHSGVAGSLLMMTGNIFSTVGVSKHLVLGGPDGGAGAISGIISDRDAANPTRLSKLEPGTWTLSGINTFTGNVTVGGGTLRATTPLRPVTGSLLVTGVGSTLLLEAAPTAIGAEGFTRSGEFASISIAAGGVITLPVADRTAFKGTVLLAGGLTIASDATLDLGSNDLVINYAGTSPIADLIADAQGLQLTAATDDGNGLPTYLAISEAADLGLTDYSGVAVDDTTVVIKFTYVGDANLDGQVDALDYERVDLAIGNSGVFGTAQGDLNYDGTVDALDYEQVDLNIGNGVGSPLSSIIVPEPASISLLAISLAGLARRRR